MNLPHFFIDRPIFAGVISILITLVGGIALFTLPIAQYPEIAPPTIQVTANYPGANAKVVAETVATPIEQQVNGVENMLYMTSRARATATWRSRLRLSSAPISMTRRCWCKTASPSRCRRCPQMSSEWCHDAEAVTRSHHGRASRFARWLARFALHKQLRAPSDPR